MLLPVKKFYYKLEFFQQCNNFSLENIYKLRKFLKKFFLIKNYLVEM